MNISHFPKTLTGSWLGLGVTFFRRFARYTGPCDRTPRGPPWLGCGEKFGVLGGPKRNFLIHFSTTRQAATSRRGCHHGHAKNITHASALPTHVRLLYLPALVSPLPGRFWPSELRSPNGNRRENTFATGATALRAFPRFRESRRSSRRGTASNKPAAGGAHGVEARRRRRSWCRRWMSDRAARQHRAGSAPSSCTSRELSA